MPKAHTFPTLYDECKTVSITQLKEWGYLKANQWKTGTITWSRNGEKYASISIAVDTLSVMPYIEFDYRCNGEPVKYRVQLVFVCANIGKGKVWYFSCPNTGKRCRKLYMINKYFLHREAFKGAMYENQTWSKNVRGQIGILKRIFKEESAFEQMHAKHFKRYYNGKETKRYLRILS